MFDTDNRILSKPSGIILIELMMVMMMGLLLVAVLLDMLMANQRSNRFTSALSTIQTNAQAAIELLRDEIQQSGYIGCPRLSKDFPLISYSTYSMKPENKLSASSANEITIRRAEANHAILNEAMQDTETLHLSSDVLFSKGDILIISDCKKAEIFQVMQVVLAKNGQTIRSLHPLQQHFSHFAEVSRFEINKYTISAYTLLKQDIKGNKTALIEGLEGMRFSYTVKRRGQLVELEAEQVDDWSSVIGVAIRLDLFSPPLTKTWYGYVAV
jgi:type IV pilus assembly protein PilW